MITDGKNQNNPVFRISSGVHIERFEDGALVAFLAKHEIIEFNLTADEILALIDGKSCLEQIAATVAENHEILYEDVLADVKDLCAKLHEWQIIEQVMYHSNRS